MGCEVIDGGRKRVDRRYGIVIGDIGCWIQDADDISWMMYREGYEILDKKCWDKRKSEIRNRKSEIRNLNS
jgi:hypothetical protein